MTFEEKVEYAINKGLISEEKADKVLSDLHYKFSNKKLKELTDNQAAKKA